MRIQKYLSQEGILSRRETESFIKRGLIICNGKVVRDLGRQIDPAKDKIEILRDVHGTQQEKITVAVNKPRGIVSGKNKAEGQTIFDLLPKFKDLNTVGRLDKESEGLLLLSNDGIITKRITGSDHTIEKEYKVEVREVVRPMHLKRIEEGIELTDGRTLPAKTELLDSHTFLLILKEGKKHQIRRMANALKLTIHSLKRVRIGTITLGTLKPGMFRVLSPKEIAQIKKPIR